MNEYWGRVWNSDDVDDVDDGAYSLEDECLNWSNLVHEQPIFEISPEGFKLLLAHSEVGSDELAAVRSQCLLRNIGMSENALKRWILIWELNRVSTYDIILLAIQSAVTLTALSLISHGYSAPLYALVDYHQQTEIPMPVGSIATILRWTRCRVAACSQKCMAYWSS